MKRENSWGHPQTKILISTKGSCIIDGVTFRVTVKEYTEYWDAYTIKFSKNKVKITLYHTSGAKTVKNFNIEKDIIIQCDSKMNPMCEVFNYFMWK